MEERLIDGNALAESDMAKIIDSYLYHQCNLTVGFAASLMPEVEAKPVRHGYWIDCDYRTLENGEIESAYKEGLCCSECRTGFKKSRMTFKKYCAACGAIMDAEPPKRGDESG